MTLRRTAKSVTILLLTLQVTLVLPLAALAQPSYYNYKQGEVPQNPLIQKVGEGNQYYLGPGNELLIRVNVWGRVQRPGQYFVPATTDLITLISMAGGPLARSRLTDIRVVRSSAEGQNEVIEVNVKKYLKSGDKRLIPDLKPEDTVIVHGSIWQVVADVVQVASQISVVATSYYFFFVAKR